MSDEDGQLVQWASLPPTGGIRPTAATKKYSSKPYRRLRPVGLGRLIFLLLTQYHQLVVKGYGDRTSLRPAGGNAIL